MKAKRLYVALLAALLLLGLGFIGIGYGANVLLSKQAAKLGTLKADAQAAEGLQASLVKNKTDIAKFQELNQIAQTVVPQDKDQAEAVRQIVNLANASGINKLSSVTFADSTLGTAVKGSTISNTDLTQLTPVPGIKGVYQLPITITQDAKDRVPYSRFLTLLTKLEQNRRTAQVSSINVQPDAKNPDMVAFVLVVNEFIKP